MIKGVETYHAIKTNQDGIDMAKLIYIICQLQYDKKQDIMGVVETNEQVYLFY